MATPYELELSAEEEATLKEARDHHPNGYSRERAAGILKVAAGYSILGVARLGLLKPRSPNTVSRWIHRYRERGIGSLKVAPGRGRKPAFFPSECGGGSRSAASSCSPGSGGVRNRAIAMAASGSGGGVPVDGTDL